MRQWDAHALPHPVFTESGLTPTRFDTAQDKARFANTLCRFIASDFKINLFTQKLYVRLSSCFGHIAHFNRNGFIEEFFLSTNGKIAFLEEPMGYPCWGQPDHTYCDVERAIKIWLRACGILPFYRAVRDAEIEAAERAQLARPRTKYEGAPPPAAPPIPRPVSVSPGRRARRDPEQRLLL